MNLKCRPFRKFWKETCGSVDAASFILLVTITALGILCGAATFRDQLVQEFGDVATDLERLDQSYSISVGTVTSSYTDSVSSGSQPVNPNGAPPSGE